MWTPDWEGARGVSLFLKQALPGLFEQGRLFLPFFLLIRFLMPILQVFFGPEQPF
jgi:hypothetical protein